LSVLAKLSRLLAFLMVTGTLMSVTASARAADEFYGVVSQTSMSSAELNLMKSGGVGSLRLTVSSGSVSPARGVFDWSELDQAVSGASAAGVSVLPAFYGTPSWMNPDFRTMPEDADSMAQWNRMLTEAVRRYGNGGTFWTQNPDLPVMPIETWQIWNEPNAKWFAVQPIVPKRYADLLIESSKTIRSIDSEAKVMLAGIFPSPDDDEGMPGATYLSKLYKIDGFRQSFDSLAAHPYAANFEASVDHLVDIREVMRLAGDGDKGLYVTEIGWGSDLRTGLGLGSQAAQADRLTRFYATLLAFKSSLKLRGIYWFAWKDSPLNIKVCSFCYGTGLLDADGNPKLAWEALTDIIGPVSTTPLEAGSAVNGGVPCVVPDVVSMRVSRARKLVTRFNCRIQVKAKRWRKSSRGVAGRVKRQSRPPMTILPSDAVVRVVVLRHKKRRLARKILGTLRSGAPITRSVTP